MLLPLVPLPMMKIRVGDGWTVVCRKTKKEKKRQVLQNDTLLDTGEKKGKEEGFGMKGRDKRRRNKFQ